MPKVQNQKEFPNGFKWGVASSAYQIEGGHNKDGRGESIWDAFCHQIPSKIDDGSNGDVACDSYNKYKEDVKLIKDIGAGMYRFSISWSRILSDGTLTGKNQLGIDYYNCLINELIANGIEPMVTLFHWDTPAALEGDWLNEKTIDHFVDYAKICFESFGDRVKNWITFNEPFVYSVLGFTWGIFAPGIKEPMTSTYVCAQNQLKAHAMAYELYDKEFRKIQNGRIGISLDSDGYVPFDDSSQEDIDAVERSYQFKLGWFAHPIFSDIGDYPTVMKEIIAKRSKEEGRELSRLPELGPEWVQRLKGSADFLGINNYTSRLVKHKPNTSGKVGHPYEFDCEQVTDPSWKLVAGTCWLYFCPWGIRKLLNWASKEYNNVEIMITENGLGASDSSTHDPDRIEYFKSYLDQVHAAIVEDGVKVTAYFAWSLIDNFEWADGYKTRFGIHSVDFTTPERTRVPRDSAKFLAKIFTANTLEISE